MTKEQNDRPIVFVTISGGVADYVVGGDVDVHLIDWDNYQDLEDFTLEDLQDRLAEIAGMSAPTAEVAKWKATAIEDLAKLVADKVESDAPCDACKGTGIFYPVEADGDASRAWVQRCDNCGKYPDDYEAADALSEQLGETWGQAFTADGTRRPALQHSTGEDTKAEWLPFGFGADRVGV